MLAQTAYLKVTRLSLRPASNLSKRRVEELNSGIGELRQLLSCVVCCQLLVDPYSPKGKRCQHNVCRLCLRGKKHLFPSCTQCEGCSDFKTYEENRMMGTQLLCYKTLCVHLLHSALFGQLAGMRPQVARELVPRIKLPPKTTQEFIREGSNISDTFDTFLPQPDLPFLKDMPTSLPAETPPTTAATTPELPYDHHLNISDIEAEAAATAEQGHFSPLPLLPTGSRMGLLSHAGQIVIATESSESGFMEQAWTDQVDLSGAVSMSNYTNSGNNFAVSYVMPTSATTTFDPQELQIGQVVQMAVEETVETSTQLTVLSTTVEETVEESVEETVEETAEETVETSTQLDVLTSAEEPNEISDQLTELEVAGSEEALVTVEEAEETPIQSEVVAEHKEEDQQLDVHTSQSPTQAEMEEAVEEHVATKTQLGQVQAELQVEEPLQTDIKDAKEAAEEAKEKDQHPSSAELQKEDIDEPTLKRKRTRSLKASQAAKIEPASSEVKAKVQSGKGALRRVRGKDKEEKVKPPKPKCRCGISGSSNTLTTCRNSRCPCYKSYNSCAGCHCVCCKNPHKEDYVESDEDDDFEDFEMLKDVPEPMTQSEEPVVAEPRQEENSRDCAPPDSSEEAISLVPLNNLQHSQHPLVLVQNEQGDYQGFNIFQGNKPLDPVAAGFTMRVQLQHTDGNGSVPQHAYMMPPITMPNPPPPSLSPPPPPAPDREVIETPAKKFRTSRTRRGRANFSALDTVDELVSGGSRSNSAAGDRSSATDNAQSLFEEIMSGSDDL